MPIREYALSRVIFEILSEPGRLRIRVTTTADMVAFGVERHQMPSTKVVAVVPLACDARALKLRRAELSPAAGLCPAYGSYWVPRTPDRAASCEVDKQCLQPHRSLL